MRYIIIPLVIILYIWWAYQTIKDMIDCYPNGMLRVKSNLWVSPHIAVAIFLFIFSMFEWIIPWIIKHW